MKKRIPVYEPWLTDLERQNLLEAFDSGWVSSAGKFIEEAEAGLERLLGAHRVHVTSSGTTALHLCLRALGIGPGDKVIIPATTFAATAFAVSYVNAIPVIVDVDERTWNLDLDLVRERCEQGDIKAIIPVHLYGNPVDMRVLNDIASCHGCMVVEDACESLGATIDGKCTGTWSDISCFSFYANKAASSGEGGCIASTRNDLADRALLLRGQAQDQVRRYFHVDIGHNYRMTNMQAAILCAQIQRFKEIQARKIRVATAYLDSLGGHATFQEVSHGCTHSWWMVTARMGEPYEVLRKRLDDAGIECRPIFHPISDLPPYRGCERVGSKGRKLHVAENLHEWGINLPSHPTLTEQDIARVCEALIT